MKTQHIPGLALAVVKDGQVIKAQGYGWADVQQAIPMRLDTAFQIGSVSKPILATAVMMLVEEGKLRLDDPVGKYLDGTPKSWKDITIRNLLTHTSGIRDLFNEPIVVNDINLFGWRILGHSFDVSGDRTEQSVLELLAQQPLNFPPGTHYSYSNSGYELLAMVIHKVTGKPYGLFLHERIFAPLGMTRTCIYGDVPPLPDIAAGYRLDHNHLIRVERTQPTVGGKGYGSGGLVTTVLDLAKWDAGLASGKLVAEPTFREMLAPARLNDGTEIASSLASWGFGQVPGHQWVIQEGRWGDWGGYTSLFQRFLSEQVTIIILTNQADMDWSSLPQEIFPQYFSEPTHPAIQSSENTK